MDAHDRRVVYALCDVPRREKTLILTLDDLDEEEEEEEEDDDDDEGLDADESDARAPSPSTERRPSRKRRDDARVDDASTTKKRPRPMDFESRLALSGRGTAFPDWPAPVPVAATSPARAKKKKKIKRAVLAAAAPPLPKKKKDVPKVLYVSPGGGVKRETGRRDEIKERTARRWCLLEALGGNKASPCVKAASTRS